MEFVTRCRVLTLHPPNASQSGCLNRLIRRGLPRSIRLASALLDPSNRKNSSWGTIGDDTRERASIRTLRLKNAPRPPATTVLNMPIGRLCLSDLDSRPFSFPVMARLPGNGKSFSSSLKPKKSQGGKQKGNASDTTGWDPAVRAAGGELRVCAICSELLAILTMIRLTQVMAVFTTREHAMVFDPEPETNLSHDFLA